MPEFILDTGDAAMTKSFATLNSFTQGYIEAAFFTECEFGTSRDGENGSKWNPETQSSLPGDVSLSDLAPETLAKMIADCQKFQARDDTDFCNALKNESDGDDSGHAGRDFWYTRNGHGCGFWDGDWLEPYATQLDKAAKSFGSFSLYLGDDGKIYHCS